MKSPAKIPYITLTLIAVNIFTAFLVLIRPDYVDILGFSPVSPAPFSLFTSLFAHANVLHLMGNMVFLAAVGAAVEIATGSGRFVAVYLLSGLLGVLLFWVSVRRLEEVPVLIGASGAIAGCATYYSLRYTKLRVPLAPKASASVAWITVTWLILQIAGAIVRIGEPVHASGFIAHLGGAVTGIVLGLVFRAPDLGSRKLGHQVYEALNDQGPSAQIEHLKVHLADHADDWEMHLKLAEQYAEMGDVEDESKILLRVIFNLQGDQLDTATKRLIDLKKVEEIPPIRRRQLSDKLPLETAIAVLGSIVSLPKSDQQRPEAIADILRLSGSDSAEYRVAKELLLKDYPNHPVTEIAKQRGWLI